MDPDLISKQLNRILTSREFIDKYRLNSFLKFIVEKKLAGEEGQLKAYTIGVEVFSRSDDFNSSIDPIVRIQAGRLRRALSMYYALEGQDDDIIIEIPKGSYEPTFSLNLPENENKKEISEILSIDKSNPTIAVFPFILLHFQLIYLLHLIFLSLDEAGTPLV